MLLPPRYHKQKKAALFYLTLKRPVLVDARRQNKIEKSSNQAFPYQERCL
jgi:hypothetical protein